MRLYLSLSLFLLLSITTAQVDYNTDIQPIFDNSCTNCHRYGNTSGGLNLESYGMLMSGNTVVSGDHASSVLWQRVSNGSMPPGANDLSTVQVSLIAQWIDEGALETPNTDFQPQSKQELVTAVNLWVSDNATALSTYGEINTWDVSLVTDMSYLFQDKTTFNDDLNNWDVSNVTDMNRIFINCHEFNGNISTWDVSNVNNMAWMFHRADQFNGDLSGWNVSSVTNMNATFYQAYAFNSVISNWNVSNVVQASSMFRESSFDQDVSSWNVSSLENPSGMFTDTPFNQDISGWDVSNATNMGHLFNGAINFNQDISNWDVSSVYAMNNMFTGASSFNRDISTWDVSSALNMDMMFDDATTLSDENKCAIHTSFSSNTNWPYDWSDLCNSFTAITQENIYEAVNMWMEDNATALTIYGEINTWDVSSVTNMSNLFFDRIDFNGDLSNWDVSSVTDMSEMFRKAVDFNQDLHNWDVSNVTNMFAMFEEASSFNGDLSNWNVSSVSTMRNMFWEATLFNSDISSWDVSNVYEMDVMFREAVSFNQDLSSWNVSNVTTMYGIFFGAINFNGDISSWNVSNVTDMEAMFSHHINFNQDISGWNVSNATNMIDMFANTPSLSEENKCAIHLSFSFNTAWQYDWSTSCALAVNDLLINPKYFKLHQNYPNPFNPITKIHYDLPKNSFVSIDIYDVMGNKIKSLVNSVQDAGYRSVYWDATNNLGQAVSAGMYIYTVNSGEFRTTSKMALIK